MLNEREPKTASIPPFALRMQPRLRKRLQKEADNNRRSLNSEIVAILEDHFKMEPSPSEPGEVVASQTARDALRLAQENAERLALIETGLRDMLSAKGFQAVLSPEELENCEYLLTALPKD